MLLRPACHSPSRRPATLGKPEVTPARASSRGWRDQLAVASTVVGYCLLSQSCCSHIELATRAGLRNAFLRARFSRIRAHPWAIQDVQRGLESRGAELDSDVVPLAAAGSLQAASVQIHTISPSPPDGADMVHDPSEH